MWTLGEAVPAAFAVTARIRGRCGHERLRDAVGHVRRRHPMLAVRVTDIGLTSAWITTQDVPEPPLRIAEGHWEQVVAEELGTPFDASAGPPARFVVIDHGDFFDLTVICHHLIGDGLSLAHLLHDVVVYLADPESPAETVAAPPMHDLVKAMPRPPRSEAFKQPGSSWPVRPRTSNDGVALVNRVLDTAEGAALKERCRAEQTSVHAALGLAGLRALADLDGDTRRQFFYPVSLRPLLTELPEGACGTYAIEVFTWFDLMADTEFWPAARNLKHMIVRQTAPDRLLRQVRLVSLTNVLPNTLMSRLLRVSCKPYPSFTLSNLGRLPFPAGHGDFGIESMHLAVHMGTLSNGILTAVTVEDRLSLTMTTTDAAATAAEQTMKATLGHLRTAIG